MDCRLHGNHHHIRPGSSHTHLPAHTLVGPSFHSTQQPLNLLLVQSSYQTCVYVGTNEERERPEEWSERSGVRDRERGRVRDRERGRVRNRQRSGVRDRGRSGVRDRGRSGVRDTEEWGEG